MSRITASIVLYNTPTEQIKRLLECIQLSSEKPQLYLVDNSPRSLEIPKVTDLDVHYLRSDVNAGYGAGHNLALRQVLDTSDFHFVLNPDIYFGREELGKMVEFMRGNPHVGQLMPKVVYPDGSLQYLCKLLPTPADLLLRRFLPKTLQGLTEKRTERFELRFTGYNREMNVPYLSGCFMLFRNSALREVGLFDERFFMYPEDIDITRRVNTKFRTVFFPGALIVHDHARESYKSWRGMWIHVSNMARYFNKWGWIRDSERSRVNRETLRQFGPMAV